MSLVQRIVIKAGPPFLVVYTNAAYCRLSGIDSHSAVGKRISTLLSIPDQDTLAEVGANQDSPSLANSTVGVTKASEGSLQEQNNAQPTPNQDVAETTESRSHAAAEAAGRVGAAASREDNTDMCLERLVAASGFGRCHVINALAKPHHMLGRNVAVMKPPPAPQMRNREEGSSITSSYDGPYQLVPCGMSVSPVVSSPEAFNVAVVTEKDQDNHHHKSKRRKHNHHSDSQQTAGIVHHQHRRNLSMREVSVHRKRHLITHYVIQLEPFEGSIRKLGGLESHSSTSTTVEAHILGLTKSELRRQRMRTTQVAAPEEGTDLPHGDGNDDEMESESSEPREPVTAIG
jgi:hypothetical protein